MCYQFKVKAVYKITEPGTALNHDGSVYVNPDFVNGRIVCQDENDDWFSLTTDYVDLYSSMSLKELKSIFRIKQEFRLLYRDRWRFIAHVQKSENPKKVAPYYLSFYNSKMIRLDKK